MEHRTENYLLKPEGAKLMETADNSEKRTDSVGRTKILGGVGANDVEDETKENLTDSTVQLDSAEYDRVLLLRQY